MKSGLPPSRSIIHNRLYSNVANARNFSLIPASRPRPRSNSASLSTSLYPSSLSLSLATTTNVPPPPARAPRETKHQLNPSPLALPPDALDLLMPLSVPGATRPRGLYNSYLHTHAPPLQAGAKRPTQYRLEVGAYGIPKRAQRAFHSQVYMGGDPMNLAVQVGEDAYFVREGAVGVADGVGGWARNLNGSEKPCHTLSSSPSALFAKRLMHYTSAEIEDKPLNDELELEGHLAELEEGIDVLNILERAYENTVRAHAPSREGSSTAVVAVLQCDEDDGEGLYGDMEAEGVYYEGNRRNYEATGKEEGGVRLDVAQVGDCMGMVVRGDEIVWRSEEMWWGFNTPVQLGMPPATAPLPPPATTKYSLPQTHAPSPSQPLSPNTLSSIPKSHAESAPMTITPRTLARLTRVPVRADDILILASDGLSDNLWDEDVLDEVGRFRGTFGRPQSPSSASECLEGLKHPEKEGEGGMGELRRRTMARMLSEALCSRARRVSERRGKPPDREAHVQGVVEEREASRTEEEREREEETPFARRAREAGKLFRGGKKDDISVVVAIVAPVPRVERKLKENL